jgi:hypothetical protein
MKNHTRVVLVALASLLLVPLLAQPGSAAPPPGSSNVKIVHALPLAGPTLVDVYLEAGGAPRTGPADITSFAYGNVVGPLAIPAGNYTVYVALAGTDTVAITQDLAVPAGLELSAVASYVSDGSGGFEPGINVFVDDLALPAAGNGRVSVRHVAAFGEVDVTVRDRFGTVGPIPIPGIANGESPTLDAPARQYIANVFPAGTTDKVAAPWVQVQPKKLTTVYAVGDPAAGTFGFLQLKFKATEMASVPG